jgi:VanZ family protein
MLRLPRSPGFWLGSFILWFVVLWVLSSLSGFGGISPPIDNIDKVEHFGYFFGGGGLLSAYLYRLHPHRPQWKFLILIVICVLALAGMLDEFHQNFTPGRSGNDPYDWLADFLGATTGSFIFKRLHHWLK